MDLDTIEAGQDISIISDDKPSGMDWINELPIKIVHRFLAIILGIYQVYNFFRIRSLGRSDDDTSIYISNPI